MDQMRDEQNQIEKDIYFSREVIKSAQKQQQQQRSGGKSSVGRVSFSPAKDFNKHSDLIEAQDRLQERKNQALEIVRDMIHFTMSMEEERQELGSPQKSANDLF